MIRGILQFWDYFMRRKGLILLFLAFFILGGIISYQILNDETKTTNPEYIHIEI